MLKKFRLKFIAINMFFVVLIISSFIILQQNNFNKRLLANMRGFAIQSINSPETLEKNYPLFNNKDRINIMIVEIDSNFSLKSYHVPYGYISPTRCENFIEILKAKKFSSGNSQSLNFVFVSKQTSDGYIYSVVDTTHIRGVSLDFLLSQLTLGTLAILLFLIMSIFLSSLAIKPVERSLNQQKNFIADASHELKTPITTMIANLNLLESHNTHVDSNGDKWLNNLKGETFRMKKLVDDLLFLARSDVSRAGSVLKEDISLNDIVTYCALNFEAIYFEHNINFITDINRDKIIIHGNKETLIQMIFILLDNAYKYGGDGCDVSLSLYKESKNVVISIHNTQNHIPHNELTKIFQRFYRTDKSRSRSKGGSGLGLSIAQEIAKLHGGNITAQSSPESGTTFKVTLSTN